MLSHLFRVALALGILAGMIAAQDAATSRSNVPIVDPAIVGTWRGFDRGRFGLGEAYTCDINPLGQYKGVEGYPSIALIEATDGRWTLRDAFGGPASSGTYRVLKNGKLEWNRPGSTISTLVRQNVPVRADGLGLTRAEVDGLDSAPKLVELLGDPDPDRRGIAALRLAVVVARHPELAVDAMPTLVVHLDDSAPDARRHSVIALGNLGPRARSAWAALVRRLQDPDRFVRHSVVLTLRRVGSDDAVIMNGLATALADAEESVSEAASFELYEAGPFPPVAVENLAKAVLRFPQNDVLRHRLVGLKRESAKAAAPVLVEALRAGTIRRLVDVDEVFFWLGPLAKDAVPLIESVLTDRRGDRADRVAAARILGRIGPGARGAIPSLSAVANDRAERRALRDAARAALEEIEDRPESRPRR